MRRLYKIMFAVCLIAVIGIGYVCYCHANNCWELSQYSDYSGSQGMFYTIKNRKDGTLIVVDGGNPGNEMQVRDVIRKNGNHVNAWFLTHYHGDHASAFNAIYKDPKGIQIDTIYATPLDWKTFEAVYRYWDTPETFREYLDITEGADNIVYLQSNDSFMIDDLRIDIFSAFDRILKQYYDNNIPDVPNNCSLVFKVSGSKDSILFCGDAHQDTLADLLIGRYGDLLQSEYVQPGHHGNNSFPEYFYDVVNPNGAFFDAPEWLMTGEQYTAEELKQYFEKKGVTVFDYSSAPNKVKFK